MSREAMKQALEALELLAKWENPLTKWQIRKPKDGGPIVTIYPHKVATDAATLLRERLAQQEQDLVKFNCTVVDDAHPEWVPLSQWGQQQKQKPFCYHDGRNIVGKEFADHSDVFPLYTRPQAREPLTEAAIRGMCERVHDYDISTHDLIQFARAIERAHGIKEKNT